MLNIVDIVNKNIPSNIKKINHFMEHGGIIYISCDFGIVQYKLSTLEFGDTYFIGISKPEIKITQTTVLNGYIYASTQDEGIKKALISNPYLIDVNQWNQVVSGGFSGITAFSNNLFATAINGQVIKSADGIVFTNFGPSLSPAAIDVRTNTGKLLITSPNSIYIYNPQLTLIAQINNSQIPEITAIFTCATVIDSIIYIGTQEQGLLSTTLLNPIVFESINPNGPSKNNLFSITASGDNLWGTYGGYNQYMSFTGQSYGFSKFTPDSGWTNIPFSKVDGALDLVRITVNHARENQIFISSYFNGLLKYEDETLITHFDQNNSGLESLYFEPNPNFKAVVVEQSVFDKAGNLWMSNGLVKNTLKVLKPNGQWQSYNMESILEDYFNARLGRMAIDKNGTKWISTLTDGLIGFNETKNNLFKKITEGLNNGNLPSPSVQVAAIDNRNQVWIGTRKGLRVLSSVDRFFGNEKLSTYPIIISEDGVAQELMYEQVLTDIVVDGANNKWIGTLDAGVFLVSPDGQETLYHFTSSNSPLPSNNVNDIDINAATGEVFFATTNGMVSFKGTAIEASDNLENVVIYPNPVRPEFQGTVKITGLLNKATVKISDIEGNLVYEVTSEGGSVEWDTTAFGKYKVQSGVYMIFISGQDGTETQVKKVMIIR